jgi:hypothetical protein
VGGHAGRESVLADEYHAPDASQALQVAQKRIQAILSRLIPRDTSSIDGELAAAFDKVKL